MELIAIENKPDLLKNYLTSGIDYIMIDLEVYGKRDRQPGNTWKSTHTLADLRMLKDFNVDLNRVIVRIDPIDSPDVFEMSKVINDVLPSRVMLPMWKSLEDVMSFDKMLDTSITRVLLFETKLALKITRDIVRYIKDRDVNFECHFGLNDLSLSLNHSSMFEVLDDAAFLESVEILRRSSVFLGIGGVGSFSGTYPVKAKDVLELTKGLGSRRVILSRSFFKDTASVLDEVIEMKTY